MFILWRLVRGKIILNSSHRVEGRSILDHLSILVNNLVKVILDKIVMEIFVGISVVMASAIWWCRRRNP